MDFLSLPVSAHVLRCMWNYAEGFQWMVDVVLATGFVENFEGAYYQQLRWVDDNSQTLIDSGIIELKSKISRGETTG